MMDQYPDYEAIHRSNKAGAEKIIAWLRTHGKDVGKHHTDGDPAARAITNLYGFLQKSVDSATVGMLFGAIADYAKFHGIPGLPDDE